MSNVRYSSASIDEFSLVTDVFVEVIKQFLRNLDADLRHTLVFAEEYLQRVAQYNGFASHPGWSTVDSGPSVLINELRELRSLSVGDRVA
jgi:hypothetical protein